MKDIISFELANKLNELGLLDNIETEYFYTGHYNYEKDDYCNWVVRNFRADKLPNIKAPTLSEAIEFLGELNIDGPIPGYKGKLKKIFRLHISNLIGYGWHLEYINNGLIYIRPDLIDKKLSLIEALEKMLEYLLENNLIGNK